MCYQTLFSLPIRWIKTKRHFYFSFLFIKREVEQFFVFMSLLVGVGLSFFIRLPAKQELDTGLDPRMQGLISGGCDHDLSRKADTFND